MITYVNSVFVSNQNDIATQITAANDGKFVIMDVDNGNLISSASGVDRIKVGMIDNSVKQYDHNGVSTPLVRWSNVIQKSDIKAYSILLSSGITNTEDTIYIDFSNLDAAVLQKFAQGGKRIIVRLTFKDTPTRFRKWTESYEYITSSMDTSDGTAVAAAKAKIASDIANLITKEWKRARVTATVGNILDSTDDDYSATSGDVAMSGNNVFRAASNGTAIQLTAMKYDDDESVNSLNKADKVRFVTNIYYTDPSADGWESHNKNYPTGVTLEKIPGYQYPASGKLVRDRENESFGYMGVLNRGEGTWPIIQPAMRTNIQLNYNAITLEFENMYRAADDIFRKTKQTLEIYSSAGNLGNLKTFFDTFAAGAPIQDTSMTTKDGQPGA